MMVVDAEVELL